MTPYRDTDFLKKARARFKMADEGDSKQALREREDLAFYAGDQWPADIQLLRQGQQPTNGMPAVPARPTLVINKVREPVRQVQNEIRDSDLGIELTPADDFGDLGVTPDDTEILLREGLVRRIVRDTNGQDAWNWAGDRADIAGRGYFAVMTRYLPGKTNDQEIYLWRIYNQMGVVGDPSRTEPDGSDAEFWFVGTWWLLDRFIAEYPKDVDGVANPLVNASDQDFLSMVDQYPAWFTCEGTGDATIRSVRVTDYWYIDRSTRELLTLADGTSVWAEDAPEGADVTDTRTVVEKTIKWCKIAGGVLVLEKTDWAGPDMPIIETLGEEMHPYDNQRRVEGMVRSARDAQKGYNAMASKWVEVVGLTPIPALQVDPEAIDGYEEFYKQAAYRAFPYLPSRTYNDEGKPFEKPHRPPVDPNILPLAQSLAMFDAAIKSTTAVPDPTLGNVDSSLKSGRAIKETVLNAKASTSNFVSNRVRSMRRACVVINNLLFPIYGSRPGRMVRVLTGEGNPEPMVIGDPQQQQQQAMQQQKAAKVAKLTEDAKFNIAVKITKNFDTKRQQENAMLGDLIGAEPTLMTWFGDVYVGSSDMPNRKQMAKRARMMLDPKIQQMLDEEEQGQEQIPPAARAKMMQMQDQLQHAEQAMQELAEEAKGKKIESQTKLQVEAMSGQKDYALKRLEIEAEFKLQAMKDATTIRVKEIDAQMKGLEMQHTLLHEADAMARTQAHEAALEESGRSHDERMALRQQDHDTAIGAAESAASAEDSDISRQASAEEAERSRQAAAQESEAGRAHEAEMSQAQMDAQATQAETE